MPFDPAPIPAPGRTDTAINPATVPHLYPIYIDAEYRDDGRQPVLFCAMIGADRHTFDLRSGDYAALQAFVAHHIAAGVTWLAYAALAELHTMLACGCDIRGIRIIDLYAEARQITLSHARYKLLPKQTNLIDTLARFEIATRGSRAWKDAMRDLILSRPDYTDAEWAQIIDYCFSDIEPLPELWAAIQTVFTAADCAYSEALAVIHGDYLVASARLEHPSRGFPLDVALLERIYANRRLVVRTLAERAIAIYGPVYLIDQKGVHFSFKGLRSNIDNQPVPVEWELTAKGRPKMDEEWLDALVAKFPYYKPLKDTYLLLNHFSRTDLRPQVRGSFIKGVSLPYHTSTGRNQPMVSRGFILNMRPWLRSMVRPEPGHVLIAADWSQQEIVVAACLSGDEQLRTAIESGDTYIYLAKMAGAVPDHATEDTHPVQRQLYKSCQLGIGYNMQERTLSHKIYIDLRDQATKLNLPMPVLADCVLQARQILDWHHDTFRTFWAWWQTIVETAQRDGWLRSLDGWTTFCDYQTRINRLGNFPVQSNAATILRLAIKLLSNHPELEYVCSLHDALYVYARAEDEAAHKATLVRCMTRAADQVLARTPMPLPIKIKTKTYTHETGYQDDRDTETLPAILNILAANGV